MQETTSDCRPPHLRYEYKPFLGSSHYWAIRTCSSLPMQARVLDVGSGSGAIGRELKVCGRENVFAIEPDETARAHVSEIYKRSGSALHDFEGEHFDIVLLLDVLEHMAKPDEFLEQLKSYLAKPAHLLVSVPNILHWSVRLSMLCGYFEYTERGILDRTHLQFFSRRRIKAMLQQHGCSILEQSSSIEPLEYFLPARAAQSGLMEALRKIRLALARAWPNMMAYQHLVLAKLG